MHIYRTYVINSHEVSSFKSNAVLSRQYTNLDAVEMYNGVFGLYLSDILVYALFSFGI